MALRDIKSNSAIKRSLDICSPNDEMPYSGQLNTIQKEIPQLLQLEFSTSSSPLPDSFLLYPVFIFLCSTIAVVHKKKNIPYAHCLLKSFPCFFSEVIFSLLKDPMHITLTAHTWNFLINGATTNDFKEFLMRLLRNSFAALNMFG